MHKTRDVFEVLPNCDPARAVAAALARACVLLRAGHLAEAAKWTAIAASRSEAESLGETV
jgi:hypothetical protein